MQKSILFRLIVIVSALTILFFSLFSYCIYKYDISIVLQHLKNESQNALDRTAKSIAYIQKDIEQFASNIIIDSELTNLLRSKPESKKDFILKYYRICRRLNTYKLQKDHIFNIYINDADGNFFSASLSEIHESTKSHDFASIQFHDGYSEKFTASVTNLNKEVVAYKAKIIDLQDHLQFRGYLYIYIDFDAFHRILQDNSGMFDQLMLYGLDDSNTLYEKHENMHIVKNEYALFCQPEDLSGGWQLAGTVPQQAIGNNTQKLILIFLVSTAVCVILMSVLLTSVISWTLLPLREITNAMKCVSTGDLTLQLSIQRKDELGKLAESFNRMIKKLNASIQARLEAEKKQEQLKSDLLLSQIAPHFLYNTLDSSVFLMAQGRVPEAIELTKSLIILLQDNLKISSIGFFSSVEEELSSLTSYLRLQSIRYPDRFSYEYCEDEKIRFCRLPRLILQPIVENALIHGILPLPRKGRIKVTVEGKKDKLMIAVQDDGIGISEEKRQGILAGEGLEKGSKMRSIGLKNIQDRLKILYEDYHTFDIQSSPGNGTTVLIVLQIGKEKLV